MNKTVRVLYVMYGMPSCYNNGFAFARRFLDDGVAITVVCDQDVSALAAVAKVPFRHLKSLSYAHTTRQYLGITQSNETSFIRKVLNGFRVVRECKKLRLQTLKNNEFLKLVTELNPDVLLIDIECHLAIIASSTLSIPTAICTRLFNHRPGDGVAPLHSNLLPSKQLGKRFRIMLQWWKLGIHSRVIALQQSISKKRIMPIHYRSFSMPDIKAIARHYEVDLKSIATTKEWFRPVTYTHVPILSMTLGEIDFDRSHDSKFDYLGPMIGDCDYAFDLQQDSLNQIDCFIEKAKHRSMPIIYCAMGTYARSEPRFVNIVTTLATSRKDYAFIISLGERESVDQYQPFSNNTLILPAAPQIRCLADSDAAILHGGIASLQEALKFRVPVLSFSVGSNDQNGTVSRWVSRGLATRFSHRNASVLSLGVELDRLLTDTALASRIEQYGQLLDKRLADFSPNKVIREICI